MNPDDVGAGRREPARWPGPERMLATAGASGGDFFPFGGARPIVGTDGETSRERLRDACRYTPGKGWKRLADLPRAAVAAPSPAPDAGGKFPVFGGDDGALAASAPTAHTGFPRDVLAYDPKADAWTRTGAVPFSPVITTLARRQGKTVIPVAKKARPWAHRRCGRRERGSAVLRPALRASRVFQARVEAPRYFSAGWRAIVSDHGFASSHSRLKRAATIFLSPS